MAEMYRVKTESPSQQFGIGKGEAQVFGTPNIDKSIHQKSAQVHQKKQLEAKDKRAKQTKREDTLMNLMAKSAGAKLKPGDMEYFAGKQVELNQGMRDALSDNEINNEEYMKMIGLANQINAEADMASANKAYLEKTMGSYSELKHRPGSYDAAMKSYNTQGNWGEQLQHTELQNTDAFYQGLYKDTAARLKEEGREIKPGEAESLLENQIIGDQVMLDNVRYDMSLDPSSKKAYEDITDEEAVDHYVNKYKDDLARKGITPTRTAGDYAREANKMLITHDASTGQFSFYNPKDKYGKTVSNIPSPNNSDERMEVHSVGFDTEVNDEGETIVNGATATIKLTDEQRADNRTVINYNKTLKIKLLDRMEKWDRQTANKPPKKGTGFLGTGYKAQTEEEFKKETEDWEKRRENAVKAEEKKLGFETKPHPTGTVELSAKVATTVFFEQSGGLRPDDVIEKKAKTPGTKFQTVTGETEEDLPFEWK